MILICVGQCTAVLKKESAPATSAAKVVQKNIPNKRGKAKNKILHIISPKKLTNPPLEVLYLNHS